MLFRILVGLVPMIVGWMVFSGAIPLTRLVGGSSDQAQPSLVDVHRQQLSISQQMAADDTEESRAASAIVEQTGGAANFKPGEPMVDVTQ